MSELNKDKEPEELNDLIDRLASFTHSAHGRFGAEQSYETLKHRMGGSAKTPNRRLFILRVSAAAALVALLLAFSWSYYAGSKGADSVQLAVSSGTERKRVILPDGSSVCLNYHSALRYSSSSDACERRVELTGEAYFEVSKNPDRPFVVEAGAVRVTVLGTHFNVMAYPDEAHVKATLIEGSVAVSDQNDSQRIILKPNESAIYTHSSARLRYGHEEEADSSIAWLSGTLSFNDDSIEEVTRTLSRRFGVTISVPDEALKSYRLTARFSEEEGLAEILELLGQVGHFTYTQAREGVYTLRIIETKN